jgi:hypothetical protein
LNGFVGVIDIYYLFEWTVLSDWQF